MVNSPLSPGTTTLLERQAGMISGQPRVRYHGTVTAINGDAVTIAGLSHLAMLGDQVSLSGTAPDGEIIALEQDDLTAILYDDPRQIKIGCSIFLSPQLNPKPSTDWIGHVLNHRLQGPDGQEMPQGLHEAPLKAKPPAPATRKRLGRRLNTGVAAFDTFLPLCQGQRIGLFAGSGVGKSTLLAELAKRTDADIVILALIGERGREVRNFVEDTLGAEGMKRAIVFAATSDDPAPLKKRTAYLAMATAEQYRDQGKQVLLLFDSLTRFAEAHREVALAAGEVPSLRAFPPSTFRAVAALTERAGPGAEGNGDITAVFSVLVAGSNMEEPVADMVRGILDGHVILEREIAERGRYPAIDVRRSVSRSLPEAATAEENQILAAARSLISAYEENAPLIRAGLYTAGADPMLDEAVRLWPQLDQFISVLDVKNAEESFAALKEILLGAPADAAPAEKANSAVG
ncbi:FliI/YscN family ATPase [Parvularcula sp. IMCC14364]|uniref:FliI/YscN family ATPase n=1 Tax=Parvularcula sp. IMCC14364 TaxID=3067902 RepID=UPI0027408162|nr:FliI/YscN family ATPase [Parvularcula sp. IMCC14364]